MTYQRLSALVLLNLERIFLKLAGENDVLQDPLTDTSFDV
jgi:hypothetical protein